MDLSLELKEYLLESGAKLVGIGDMSGVENLGYPVGVSVALPVPRHIVRDLQTAPTREYYEMYHELNSRLNEIVRNGERFLTEHGFNAYAQTTDRVKTGPEKISPVPHKTVATRAGLGWIGKNCLLVTPQYGPAVRISSILTDAPLRCDVPIQKSRCGGCELCVRACPGQALNGALWEAGMPRAEIVDIGRCYETQVEIMKRCVGIETDLCGKCFAVCAYTRRYLNDASGGKSDE